MRESDRLKIYQAKNEKTNLGVCVCLRGKAPKGKPKDDVVTLCFGELDKKGRPKNQFLMTSGEANCLGSALIGAGWLHIKEEKSVDKEN